MAVTVIQFFRYLLKPGFNSRQDHVGFVLNKVALIPSVSLVSAISPKHHTYSLICHRQFAILSIRRILNTR